MRSTGEGVLSITRPAAAPLPDSFDDWATARWPALVRFAGLVVSAYDAEDVVQDALVGAYPRWTQLRAAGTPDAYVRRSIINASISRWRRHGRREQPADDAVLADLSARASPQTRDPAGTVADAAVARDLLTRLPAAQRAAVVLRYYDDLTFAEIASVLGCAEVTARSHVHRALATLRELLPEDDHD